MMFVRWLTGGDMGGGGGTLNGLDGSFAGLCPP
jgi:hypothetical protein